MELSTADKKELLRIARETISATLNGKPTPPVRSRSETLNQLCGAFVTLHLLGELRGCIGYIEPRYSLLETVGEVAQKAALEDPRFPPLTTKELEHVEIEISVLSPLKKVSDVNEIVVGTHGLVIDAGYTRGLLLPQVATEWEWGREQFLSQTCRKAGLPADAWKQKKVTIYSFTSAVFSEAEMFGVVH
jgi:AmmeMemoRadiSam system protein A